MKTPRKYTPQRAARSNTGHIGISETALWVKSKRFECFAVNWREKGQRKLKRFFYGPNQRREAALAAAVKFRQGKAGK